MAVALTATSKNISWASLATVQNVQQKTFLIWLDVGATGSEIQILSPTGASDEEWSITIGRAGPPTDRIIFVADWSTTQGQWYTTNTIATGNRLIGLTYDYGSASNNPVVYIDGASVAVTTSTAPSGTYRTGTSNTLRIGSSSFALSSTIYSSAIYNRILSPAEILDAYNSRKAIPTYNGLVFAPDLRGAAGGVDEGDTLGATNYIRDRISGATGTPSGSPVFAADNYLNY